MPKGFQGQKECGRDLFNRMYQKNKDPLHEPFNEMIDYAPLPTGTDCERYTDFRTGLHYVELRVQTRLEFGNDYAFEFGIYNAEVIPPPTWNDFTKTWDSNNVWRIETLLDGVVLHLERDIPGYDLAEIYKTNIIPGDTTTRIQNNKIMFEIMSVKLIPGASTIRVLAPVGFSFRCGYKETYNLSKTTTCQTRDNEFSLDMDTLDELQAHQHFAFEIFTINPSFTPNPNTWSKKIIQKK